MGLISESVTKRWTRWVQSVTPGYAVSFGRLLRSVVPVAVVDRAWPDGEGEIWGLCAILDRDNLNYPSATLRSERDLRVWRVEAWASGGGIPGAQSTVDAQVWLQLFTAIAPYNPYLLAPLAYVPQVRPRELSSTIAIVGYNPAAHLTTGIGPIAFAAKRADIPLHAAGFYSVVVSSGPNTGWAAPRAEVATLFDGSGGVPIYVPAGSGLSVQPNVVNAAIAVTFWYEELQAR